jgi:hydrophobic/amphiphilic exporter-1 (mainly G- bacteria), HAE1 family
MLSRFAVRHPITVAMIMLGIVILGGISVDRLGTDLLPSMYNPQLVVELQSGERSPQEMESRFARQIEGDVRSVRHVVDVQTLCRLGVVQVTVTFTWGTDMDFALLDVQKKMARYETRSDVDRVTLSQYDPQAAPVLIYAMSGATQRDMDEIRRLAENVIKLNLERLDGVSRVQVYGGVRKEVRVELDAYRLAAFQISQGDVTNAITRSNADASGGTLDYDNKAYTIKGIGRFSSVADVGATVVGYKSSQDSLSSGATQAGRVFESEKTPIYLTDVASVTYAPTERTELVRLGGRDCLALYIYKEAEDNTIRVAEAAEEALNRMALEMPILSFDRIYSQADFISNAIGEVESSALIGVFLAMVVLFIFLRNVGATIIISLAIPLSILATFTLMYFQELTLNIMTLGGLALGAGMLVDNAIVVIENIFRRRQLGEGAIEAAIQGANEVGVPIIAATLTTIIVFLPIVFVQGIAAELFKEQAWVVAYALLSSLLIAFLFIPTIAARIFKQDSAAFARHRLRIGWYDNFLAWSLDHKVLIIGLAAVMLAGAVLLIPVVGTEFIPRSTENQLQIDLELAPGTPLDHTESVMTGVETRITEALGNRIQALFSTANVTANQTFLLAGNQDQAHQATITLLLASEGADQLDPETAIRLLQPHLDDLPGLATTFHIRETSLQQTVGLDAAPIAIEIRGADLTILESLGEQICLTLEQAPELHTIESSTQRGRPEINLRIDRVLAASFGLDLQQIGQRVKERLDGEVVSDFFREGEDRDIRVAFPTVSLDELGNLPIETSDGVRLRLKDVAALEESIGPTTIRRHNQTRIVTVSAYLNDEVTLSTAVSRINRLMGAIPLPAGYRIQVAGAEESRQASFGQLQFALILSIILVYMVMASLFESLLHPFTILLTLPLAGVGVVFSFFLVGEPFSVMAFIGIVMLGGIAVNDSIVLVDYINRLRQRGTGLRESVIQGTRDRLRPILMTSATTILALLPLTIGLGEGARLRAPMALAVIGGLVTSTLLTLVVIPTVYEIVESLKVRKSES